MKDIARARARELALRFRGEGRPTEWFEEFYRSSAGDTDAVPWADGVPNPLLVAWASATAATGANRRALVTGCGLGDDAVFLAALGFRVTAFDIAPTAVEWARRIMPEAAIEWRAADLLRAPPEWHTAFDLVLDVYTVQSLPPELQDEAIAAIAAFVAPDGELVAICRGREETAPPAGPPWPLAPSELRRYATRGLSETSFESLLDDGETPPQLRFRATFRRDAAT